MTGVFRAQIGPMGVDVGFSKRGFLGRETTVPVDDWHTEGADREILRALLALRDQGRAVENGSRLRLTFADAAALSSTVSDILGFPPLSELGLAVSLRGRVESPDGILRLRWVDRTAREVFPVRTGFLIELGLRSGRLSPQLLSIVEATAGYNETQGGETNERIAAWMPVQRALAAISGEVVRRDGFLETFTIYQAGAFALDVSEDSTFAPSLMGRESAANLDDNAPADEIPATGDPAPVDHDDITSRPLLSPDDQRTFGKAFAAGSSTRSAYGLGLNRFVLIDAALRTALDVVRRYQRAPEPERREFLRNPRQAIAAALEAGGETATQSAELFVETGGYSDRIARLGLWEKPKIPWMTRVPNDWLPESGWVESGEPVEPIPLSDDELAAYERAYDEAEARGEPTVVIRGVPIPIDSVPGLLEAERRRSDEARRRDTSTADGHTEEPQQRLVLVIEKTNFDAADYCLALERRQARVPLAVPMHLMGPDRLKPHQAEGFDWLVDAWRAGWPGVLLADDMGLGKTFQALSFMAWLREHMSRAGAKPVLVVAPTALLRNWEKEAADRLRSGALGKLVRAYGSDLTNLRLSSDRRADMGETLDRRQLRDADWILTTYETLTDHERAFAPIEYGLIVFDEMQKVKAPDTLNTKAARAMNADFVLGLTGTPIENRMEDLWCIFDRVTPGYLGDLKSFSSTYNETRPDNLSLLKARLDQPVQTANSQLSAPPVMKRRMKSDVLEGLPRKQEERYNDPMPTAQAAAYRQVVSEALREKARDPGFMLKTLHAMRGISLHPDNPAEADVSTGARFEAFADRSARLSRMIAVLRDIERRGQKALIFVEFLEMQHLVADGISTLFNLPHRLDVINGSVPGEKRLGIVERFSSRGLGFDVLILSPRAAGVGLNITAANHVIHLSRWWNPAVEDQCNDRAYRIGQNLPVTIHIPIATLPELPDGSFDQRLDALLTRKRELSRHMLAPPTSTSDVSELFGATVDQASRK